MIFAEIGLEDAAADGLFLETVLLGKTAFEDAVFAEETGETGETEFLEDGADTAGFAAAEDIKGEEEELSPADRLEVSIIEDILVEGTGFSEQDTKTGVSNKTGNTK